LYQDFLVYIDGRYYSKEESKISVFDHGLLYGDGVFEGIRSYDGHVFKLEEHIKRLYESANSIELDIPLTKKEFKQAILETLRKNKLKDAYIRVLITRGVGTLGLNPLSCPKPSIIIIADQLAPLFEGKEATAIIASTRRNALNAINPMIKSLNYLNNILAKIEALDNDVPEAIMYNHEGYVAEATGDNVFIVRDSVIYTPPVEAGALEGITRGIVIKLAKEENLEVVEKNLTRCDLYICDEFFLTGTAAEVIGIVEIDGRVIGDGKPGSYTRLLRKKFFRYAHRKEK